jgi:aspartyl-tRNA(Asn)/glutamyl-tRNA(Gln) amidotransferase subunit C
MPEPESTPTVTRDDLARLAQLARIALTEEELDHLAPQLAVILDSVASVRGVAGDDVPPSSHALALQNVMRPDEIRASLTREDVLSGAPEAEQQRFKVPRILGEEQ